MKQSYPPSNDEDRHHDLVQDSESFRIHFKFCEPLVCRPPDDRRALLDKSGDHDRKQEAAIFARLERALRE